MVLDASPMGFGGVLLINGRPFRLFADIVTKDDEKILTTQGGADKGQQVWEALCLLIALRLWRDFWMARRSLLCARSDNIAGLAMVSKLKAKGPRAIIARELATLTLPHPTNRTWLNTFLVS